VEGAEAKPRQLLCVKATFFVFELKRIGWERGETWLDLTPFRNKSQTSIEMMFTTREMRKSSLNCLHNKIVNRSSRVVHLVWLKENIFNTKKDANRDNIRPAFIIFFFDKREGSNRRADWIRIKYLSNIRCLSFFEWIMTVFSDLHKFTFRYFGKFHSEKGKVV